MRIKLRISEIRTLSFFTALILALPITIPALTGFYTWLSPFIMLNSVIILKSFVLLNFISIFILIFSIIRKRWFCRYLCPVGRVCDLISAHSCRKSFSLKKLPEIGKWIAIISPFAALVGFPLLVILDPMSIFNGFFPSFSANINFVKILSLSGLPLLMILNLFMPGIWCNKLCPLGGLQLIMFELKNLILKLFKKNNTIKESADPLRRLMLASGTGLIAGFFIPKFLKPHNADLIRPPASVPADLFNTLCIRCGNCIKACPTDILIHHTGTNPILAWMTPEVSFEKGYCLETCNLCGRVCPSGAITLFSTEAKKEIFMGSAEINLDNCLLLQNTECDRCKEACKYAALDIVPLADTLMMKPEVIKDKCVGCGACAVICPVLTISIKTIHLNA